MIKIVDDYFPQYTFNKLKKVLFSNEVPWFHIGHVANNNEPENMDLYNYYFTHSVYIDHSPNSALWEEFSEILTLLDIKSLIRIRINLYPRTEIVYKHGFHQDFLFEHNTCLIYMNTCNGYTAIDDTIVESIENRVVFFNGNVKHHSTTCTDSRTRMTVAISYF